MNRRRLAYSLALACLALAVTGCSDGGVATEGRLLLNVASPLSNVEDPCCGPNTASVSYSVSCDPDAGGTIALGGLEVVDEQLWQGLVDGLPPGDCVVSLLGRSFDNEVSCSVAERVSIVAGKLEGPTIVLVCDDSSGPRTDLTAVQRQACFEAESPCFLVDGF